MTECIGTDNPNCGLGVVQRLAKERSLLIDYDPSSKAQKLMLGPEAAALLVEVADVQKVYGTGIHDIAEFGCLACGKCIRFEDDDADYLVDDELMSTY